MKDGMRRGRGAMRIEAVMDAGRTAPEDVFTSKEDDRGRTRCEGGGGVRVGERTIRARVRAAVADGNRKVGAEHSENVEREHEEPSDAEGTATKRKAEGDKEEEARRRNR